MILDATFRFEDFVNKLSARMQLPLPGYKAQYTMAREFRAHPKDTEIYHEKAKLGAVLILFYPYKNQIYTVLIQRQAYNGVHSAQIAFPGGKKDESDVSLIQTALREAHEEVGIVPEKVQLIGELTKLYIPPSNFLVSPVLGFSDEIPSFLPQQFEVAEIIEVPLQKFLQDELIKEKVIDLPQQLRLKVKYFDVSDKVIWGATAMMIAEMREILKEI